MKKHFIDLADLKPQTIRHILSSAKARKKMRTNFPKGARDKDAPLEGYLLIALFENCSTRTRASFHLAMQQLGGVIMVLDSQSTQMERGEDISDTAKVLSLYGDIIMLRSNAHEHILSFAKYATIPVINGLTPFCHPCQIMADIMSFEEAKGDVRGQKIAWIGDGNNVCVSWIHASVKLGFDLHIACPQNHFPPKEVLGWAENERQKNNENQKHKDKQNKISHSITLTTNKQEAAKDAACIVTDCFVSMSDGDKEKVSPKTILASYQVDEALMSYAQKDALFLHCLPAYRGQEVSAAVIDGPQSKVLLAADNRTHVQKAILLWCLGKLKPIK